MSLLQRLARAGMIALLLQALFLGPLLAAGFGRSAVTWLCELAFAVASTEAALSIYSHLAVALDALRTRKVTGDRGGPSGHAALPAAVPAAPPAVADALQEVRSVLVLPVLLVDAATVDELLQSLEALYLSNRGGGLYFGLLTDFCDAASVTTPGDDALLALAGAGIERLNARHAALDGGRFFLMHRPRVWAPRQGVWMGHERKRGKLLDFALYLCSGDRPRHSFVAGATAAIVGARFVITLDEDNTLPHGGAHRLIAHMLEPANAPVVDPQRRVVVSGHAMLQPWVVTVATAGGGTRYERLQTVGMADALSVEVLYHALLDEGTFFGKGIYCARTFVAVLAGRIPDDRVLSHDILEGCFLRSGIVADAYVTEGVPRSLPVALRRAHRWVRGDWQSASWVRGHIASEPGGRNPLSALSRWKLAEGVRRTLVPCAILLMLACAWLMRGQTRHVFAAALLLRVLPPTLGAAAALWAPTPAAPAGGGGARAILEGLRANLARELLFIVTLPGTVGVIVDAVARAVWRMQVSGRHLLEWTSSRAADRGAGHGFGQHLRAFRLNLLAVAAYGAGVYAGVIRVDWITDWVVLAWLCAPAISWWLADFD